MIEYEHLQRQLNAARRQERLCRKEIAALKKRVDKIGEEVQWEHYGDLLPLEYWHELLDFLGLRIKVWERTASVCKKDIAELETMIAAVPAPI